MAAGPGGEVPGGSARPGPAPPPTVLLYTSIVLSRYLSRLSRAFRRVTVTTSKFGSREAEMKEANHERSREFVLPVSTINNKEDCKES